MIIWHKPFDDLAYAIFLEGVLNPILHCHDFFCGNKYFVPFFFLRQLIRVKRGGTMLKTFNDSMPFGIIK